MQFPGRGFSRLGPGEQIMPNEVQVNVTRRGSWQEMKPLSWDLSVGQTEGQTHRKYITADAGHVRHKALWASVTYKEILERTNHLGSECLFKKMFYWARVHKINVLFLFLSVCLQLYEVIHVMWLWQMVWFHLSQLMKQHQLSVYPTHLLPGPLRRHYCLCARV